MLIELILSGKVKLSVAFCTKYYDQLCTVPFQFFQCIQGERDIREKVIEDFALFAENLLSRLDHPTGEEPSESHQDEEALKKSMALSVEQLQDR